MTVNQSFCLPAEWYPQDAVMLTWPHAQTDWQAILPQVEPIYVELVKTISQFQSLVLVCDNEALKQHIKALLAAQQIDANRIFWVITPTNDTWARDHGPVSLVKGKQVQALDFTFNGWGNKFEASLDNKINQALFNQLNIKDQHTINLVLEGGGIESDGNGCLMATTECLLNPNRNPDFSQAELETLLLTRFGLQKILWLEHGALDGDDTDAHIDTLARFAPDNCIVYQACTDQNDSHFASLNAMKTQLQTFTNLDNQAFKLVELPWPDAQFSAEGDRLPATYANFLVINQAVLVPIYGVKQDQIALEQMQVAFPQHQIIGINCRPIIEQYGSLHCITMQLPQGFLSHYLN
ncbi:agmatine deiminase family protein [Catenovulum sp. 2E275]|uniref:agmatine deiminase family protein n=1 Tax=Catenovulum sp. 2E275 TaxID=2980497 RepID=UPI0021D3AE1F|nr:agmatine deiminase family protein [Catenovulum sp. 2E275]MCU4674921.1 agmatine deiminase family protein [Catenovulum sp. 2E275]